jgi:glycosyltransferase involved in cell wall biosynthesis
MATAIQNNSMHAPTPVAPFTVAHVVEGCQGGVGSAVRHLIVEQSQDPTIGEVYLLVDPRRMGEMLHGVPATVSAYESSRSPLRLLRVAQGLRQKLRSIAPDVVYLHSTFPGLYGRMLRSQDRQSWATVYCAHGWAFTQKLPFAKKKFYTAVERLLAPRADAVVSISYSEFDAAEKANVVAPLHRVIYHGVPQRKEPAPAPIQVDPERINLAFIGRFDRQKGLDLLLQVFADPQLSHITLWLIGESTLGHKYIIPEQPNIKLIGWVPNDRIDDYIQCFDAVVVPSRWEGFGLIALETMRNARPVLASRTGGLAELLIDGVNGRLFHPDDPSDLLRVLRRLSKPELARMGAVALDVFHTGFQLNSCYSRWSALTQDALARRVKARRATVAASYLDAATVLTMEDS